VRVHNPDRAAFSIDSRYAAPTPTGFPEIASNGLPLLHGVRLDPSSMSSMIPARFTAHGAV